jgi:hypothetical protein
LALIWQSLFFRRMVLTGKEGQRHCYEGIGGQVGAAPTL